MEFYMEPALLWFWPPLAKALTQFRFEGLGAAEKQAKIFGYAGAQFPWCTVSSGRSAGCCDGKGGDELCLEQHITPDVGFAMQQYYRWTGDKDWLKEIGYPIAQGVARWLASRVKMGSDSRYHILKVMPVDEWCWHDSGCGNPGVNDDPQMNGASVAALRFASEAAVTLGVDRDEAIGWAAIAGKLLIPRGTLHAPDSGTYTNVHLMPKGTVPSAMILPPFFDPVGPSNRSNGHATVCPEDVMYLSYPMGPALNISSDQTSRDLDAWIGSGLTCLENGGMTHPIRIVSFLLAQEHNSSYNRLAEQALNGTMYGCCYGPYNLRNEIDRHNTTVGGHTSNTHFITGDGGFINAFVSGFGGVLLGAKQGALQLNQPTIPERTSGLVFRGLKYLDYSLDYRVSCTVCNTAAGRSGVMTLNFTSGGSQHPEPLCLRDASGTVFPLSGAEPKSFTVKGWRFPSFLGPCSTLKMKADDEELAEADDEQIAKTIPVHSWDTLPVVWHSALGDAVMSPAAVKNLSKFPLITLEKSAGSNALHWPHGLPLTCQNGTNLSACGCCEEDLMIAQARQIKALNPKAHISRRGEHGILPRRLCATFGSRCASMLQTVASLTAASWTDAPIITRGLQVVTICSSQGRWPKRRVRPTPQTSQSGWRSYRSSCPVS